MDFFLLINFFILSLQIAGLFGLAYSTGLTFPKFMLLFQLPLYLPMCFQLACSFSILSSNPLYIMLNQPLLVGITYLVALMGLLYLSIYVYSEVLCYRKQGGLHFLFQEQDDSVKEVPQRFPEYPRRTTGFKWPRRSSTFVIMKEAQPSLYEENPQEYTTRRLLELKQNQQFKDMQRNLIPSRWKGTVREPSDSEKRIWLEEFAGRRDLYSNVENVFAPNAYDPPKSSQERGQSELRRFNSMHNTRVSSKTLSPLSRAETLSHYKLD